MTQMLKITFDDHVEAGYPLAECVKYFGLVANMMEDVPADSVGLHTTSAEFEALFAACKRCDGPIKSECAEYMLCVFPANGDIHCHFVVTGNVELLRDAIAVDQYDDFIVMLCEEAIASDQFECFVLLYDRYLASTRAVDSRRNDDRRLGRFAVEKRPEFVKYMHEKGAIFRETLAFAVMAGQHETLKFLLTVDETSRDSAHTTAIMNDDDIAMEILMDSDETISARDPHEYFMRDSVKCFSLVYDELQLNIGDAICAAKYRAAKCLREMCDSGFPMTRKVVLHSAFDVECMKYVWNSCRDMHPRACEYAAALCNLDSFVFAHEHGALLTSQIYLTAVANGSLEIIKYAFAHGCPLDDHTRENIAERELTPGARLVLSLFGCEVVISMPNRITAKITYRGKAQ